MKCRIIYDMCTPTRERRPTYSGDIEDDVQLEDLGSEEEVLEKLLDLAGYDEEDMEFEEDATIREKIENLLRYFSDPGDGSPNILYLSIDGEVIQDAWYDCLEGLDLENCNIEDVQEACINEFAEEDED